MIVTDSNMAGMGGSGPVRSDWSNPSHGFVPILKRMSGFRDSTTPKRKEAGDAGRIIKPIQPGPLLFFAEKAFS